MEILVTTNCPLNCKYCFKEKNLDDPSLNKIKELIDKSDGEIILKGGDPLLREDILQIVEYAKSQGKIGIKTNGALLGGNILENIDRIYFELDTINFEVWKEITGGSLGEFKTIIGNIKISSQKGKDVYIDALLTTLNIDYLNSLKKFCDRCGLKLRILENPFVGGFEYSNSIRLPIDEAKFLGDDVEYVETKENLINKESKYYKKK